MSRPRKYPEELIQRRVFGSAGGARAARRSRLALVSSRRHFDPCMRFSRTRLTDVLHRRHSASPAPWRRPRRDDGSVEVDQPHPVCLVSDDPPAIPLPAFVTLSDEPSQTTEGVERDLVEELGGVSIAEVARPAAQEPVDFSHDHLDRDP
jgi:hypothetical protein